MQAFREIVDCCAFQSLETNGPLFTWSNMRDGRCHIQERLDMFFTNTKWLSIYPGSKIRNVTTSFSDNNCLIFNIIGAFESQQKAVNPFGLRLRG